MATEEGTNQILITLFNAYPRAVLREDTLRVYADFLKDIPDEVLKAAVAEHMRTCEFFPTISQLVKIAANIQTGVGSLPSAMEAWGEVSGEIRAGEQMQPKFTNILIDQVVSDMGWYNLRMSENLTADRARFIDAYDAKIAYVQRIYAVPASVRRLASQNARELSQYLLPEIINDLRKSE